MQRPAVTFLVLLAAALPARGADFIPGWDVQGIWDSNVFRTVDKDQFGRNIPKEDGPSIRTGPNLRVREDRSDLTYDLSYQLRYEYFPTISGINDFDHFVNGSADWEATPTTHFSVSDDFGDSASLGGLFEFVGPSAQLVVRGARERIITNAATASMRHSLGPLWEITFSGSHQLFDFQQNAGQDADSVAGSVQLTRGITPRMVSGFGVTAQRDTSDTGSGGQNTGSNFFQAFGIFNYDLSRTFRFTASAGPALTMPDKADVADVQVFSHQPWNIATCPKLPDGSAYVPLAQAEGFSVRGPQCQPLVVPVQVGVIPGTPPTPVFENFIPTFDSEQIGIPFTGDTGVQNSITYFARVQLEKSWTKWHALMSYSRSAENGSGLGTSTFVDSLIGQVTYQPTQDWTFTLNAFGTKQTAISEVRSQRVEVVPVVDTRPMQSLATGQIFNITTTFPDPVLVTSGDKIKNPIDVMTYRVELRADRRIRRNLIANVSGSWYDQTNSGRFASNTRTEYRVVLGVTWTFDPIPIPL